MTIHEALYTPMRQPLLMVLFLLLTARILLLCTAFWDARSPRYRLVCLLYALAGSGSFYLPLFDICWEINYPSGAAAPPALLGAFQTLPVAAMAVYEALTALILLLAFREQVRYRRDHPTFESIKEAMDLLPAGIAFARLDGTVLLSNLAAGALSRALTGKALTNLTAFRAAAGLTGPEKLVPLPDGSAVWQITDETFDMDGSPCVRLTATDVTEQAAVIRNLEERSRKLRRIQKRLQLYNRQADRLVIAQELLRARMSVHSEVGHVLLESRRYLNDPASFDEERLLQALKNANTYLLREFEADDTVRDPLVDAVEMAQAIGVDVSISGPVPAAGACREILASAINECASNTVKHADGDRLSVTVCPADGRVTFLLRSNKAAPGVTIRESGGLRDLRALVEHMGGEMRTRTYPQVLLTIQLPSEPGERILSGAGA